MDFRVTANMATYMVDWKSIDSQFTKLTSPRNRWDKASIMMKLQANLVNSRISISKNQHNTIIWSTRSHAK